MLHKLYVLENIIKHIIYNKRKENGEKNHWIKYCHVQGLPLYYLSFDLWLLITPLVSKGQTIQRPKEKGQTIIYQHYTENHRLSYKNPINAEVNSV